MKKIFFSFLALVFAAMGVNAQKTIHDPDVVKVDVKNFHAINVSNAFNVYISQGNDEAVAVSASEEKYREKIKTTVEGGVLKIWYENDGPNIVWTDDIYHNVKKLKNIQTEKNELSRDFLCGSKFLK